MSEIAIPFTSHHYVDADGVRVFYREAGPANAPVVLLLHGFPTSSFQYRELIPRLADRYRVIAPDLPGFGFTEIPAERSYVYTFDALAKTMLHFIEALDLQGTRCTSSITALPRAFASPCWRRNAYGRSSRRTAMHTRKAGDAWHRSSVIGGSQPRRTVIDSSGADPRGSPP